MKTLGNNPLVPSMVVSAMALGLIAWMSGRGQARPAYAQQESVQNDAAPPVRVEVSKPKNRPLHKELRMPATLMAWETADLYAKVSGYVSQVLVDIGYRVEKGETLIEIAVPEMHDELRQAEAVLAAKRAKVDALQAKVAQAESEIATARAAVEEYRAQRDLSKITRDRKKELLDAHAIPDQDFDEAASRLAVTQAEVESARAKVGSAKAMKEAIEADRDVAQSEVGVAQAQVARLKTLMEYATIRAPFDGVITQRHVDPGDFVRSAAEGATDPLLVTANVGTIRLVLHVPESDATYVKETTGLAVDVKTLNDKTIEANVARTAKSLDPRTRTMRVEADLENISGRLAPGMYAEVTVRLETKAEAMMIPSKAVRVRGRETSVLVAAGGNPGPRLGNAHPTAEALPITIGYDDGIWAEVLEGLSGTEAVIIAAASALAPGVPVAPTEAGL